MDSLEAFERGRDLNPGSPINHFKAEILPLKIEPSIPHVWQGFTRSAVFFLDEHIMLKAQKQYHVPSISLPGDRLLLEFGLANFEGTQLERQIFTILQSSPHPNLVRCLNVCRVQDPELLEGILFFERLDPLSTVLAESSVNCRRRWAIALTSACSHLESLGLIPTHACVGDLGLDKCVLKLFQIIPCHIHPSTMLPVPNRASTLHCTICPRWLLDNYSNPDTNNEWLTMVAEMDGLS